MKIELEITPQQICDQFVTALEGGSNYWLDKVTYTSTVTPSIKPWYADPSLFTEEAQTVITLQPSEGDPPATIDQDSIRNGLALLNPLDLADIINEDGDAITADRFLQMCAFGEIVYG